MSRPLYYVPQVSRFLVSALYHEAKRQRIPMTRLANNILESALRTGESWREAERVLREQPSVYRPKAS